MRQPEHFDSFIVLGGGITTDGIPSIQTNQRALAAAAYYDQFKPSMVLFSGNTSWHDENEGLGTSEAEVMADIAMIHGIPACAIECESTSTSTLSNFVHAVAYVEGQDNVGVVTHAYHQRRALFIARKVLFSTVSPLETRGGETILGELKELANFAVTKALLHDVEQGDIETLLSHEASYKHKIHDAKRLLQKI